MLVAGGSYILFDPMLVMAEGYGSKGGMRRNLRSSSALRHVTCLPPVDPITLFSQGRLDL